MVGRVLSLLSIAVILNVFLISQGKKPKHTIEFTKMECVNQRPEIIQINCLTNRTSKNIMALYVDFKFSEDIKSTKGNFLVAIDYNKKFINYTSVDMDYCASLHMVHTQSLIQMIAVGLRTVSNFPLNCPFKKNYTYIVNGFTLDPKIVPVYMPTLSFIANASIIYNKRSLFYVAVFGQVTKK